MLLLLFDSNWRGLETLVVTRLVGLECGLVKWYIRHIVGLFLHYLLTIDVFLWVIYRILRRRKSFFVEFNQLRDLLGKFSILWGLRLLRLNWLIYNFIVIRLWGLLGGVVNVELSHEFVNLGLLLHGLGLLPDDIVNVGIIDWCKLFGFLLFRRLLRFWLLLGVDAAFHFEAK